MRLAGEPPWPRRYPLIDFLLDPPSGIRPQTDSEREIIRTFASPYCCPRYARSPGDFGETQYVRHGSSLTVVHHGLNHVGGIMSCDDMGRYFVPPAICRAKVWRLSIACSFFRRASRPHSLEFPEYVGSNAISQSCSWETGFIRNTLAQ